MLRYSGTHCQPHLISFIKSLKISLEITKQQPVVLSYAKTYNFSNAKTIEESVVLSYAKTDRFSYYYGAYNSSNRPP